MTNTPQGLIAPAILVPATALNDANRGWLVDEVASFAIWAESEAMLVLGEYPIEAQWANACLYYIGQVENGGHGQFASNSDMRPVTISGIDKALAASGYGELHAIFRDFQALMEAPEVRQRAMETAGFEGTPEALKVLDRRYFALGDADAKVGRLSEWTASWTPPETLMSACATVGRRVVRYGVAGSRRWGDGAAEGCFPGRDGEARGGSRPYAVAGLPLSQTNRFML